MAENPINLNSKLENFILEKSEPLGFNEILVALPTDSKTSDTLQELYSLSTQGKMFYYLLKIS